MRPLLFVTFVLTAALPSREPAIGRFLIATPQVGGYFAESVIVLVDHGDNGSLGLIVNRRLTTTLGELLPDIPGAKEHREPVWFGGPVSPEHLLLLVRAPKPPTGAAPVLDGVSVSGSYETLQTLLAHPPAHTELRGYVGYAGWAPGQLADEIARGDWLVAPGDADSVFTHDPAALWQQLLRKHSAIEVKWPAAPLVAPSDKSINLSPPWRSAAASSGSRTSARARSSTR